MLSGERSCGKTSTLNMVYNSINPTEGDIIEPRKQLGGNPHDFECIVCFNERKVAFFTMGDYSCYLLEAFEKYNTKCDYLICACNTRFVKPYERINNFEHVIIDKRIAIGRTQEDCNIANNLDKEEIITEILL